MPQEHSSIITVITDNRWHVRWMCASIGSAKAYLTLKMLVQ